MAETRSLGIYLHWPWCQRICPYCDFNVYRARGADSAAMRDAMRASLKAWRALTGPRRLASLFLGGGTPSLMEPRDVGVLVEDCASLWGFEADAEITLEANPTDACASRFAGFAAAGVNRLSLGLQALNDPDLKRMGRDHNAAEARRAADLARAAFSRLSIDLIHSRPGQTLDSWSAELQAALDVAPDHVSPYQLTIEAGTAFARMAARGALDVPEAGLGARFLEVTGGILEAAGFEAYEISNYARGRQARSRHNMLYWTQQDWIGLGPGAHGRIGPADARRATLARMRPDDWMQAVARDGLGLVEDSTLDPAAARDEYWLSGLRLAEGADLAAAPSPHLEAGRVAAMVASGHACVANGRLALTPSGRLVADRVMFALLGG